MSTVLCVGSAAKDIFFPTAEGEFIDTPDDLLSQRKVMFEAGAKYQVEDRYEALGGVAANTSVGLSRLGLSASVYGATGDDDIGRWIRNELGKEGVGLDRLETFANVKSDLSAILVFTTDGDRTIFYNRDSAERFRVSGDAIAGASWVVVSALNGDWKANLRETLRGVREAGAKLAVNPGQRNMKDDPELVLEAVALSDVLLLNKDEAIELVLRKHPDLGKDANDERILLEALSRHGAKTIAMTDGVRGAWGFDGENMFHSISKHPEKGIDTTGAGDAFGSAFLAATIGGKSLDEALRWGMANGASVIHRYGAIEGLLRQNEIESKLDEILTERVDR